jgi:hypothetical protein
MMKISKQFIQLPSDLLTSPALMVLNIRERRCLDRMLIEHARHGGRENGRLPVTHRDLGGHGVHSRRVAVCLQVIEALGLVVCTQRGRGGNRDFRRPSFWRITFLTTVAGDKLSNGQTKWLEPTHEWANIETVEQATAIADQHRIHDKRKRRPPPRPPRPKRKEQVVSSDGAPAAIHSTNANKRRSLK